jgi:DNA-binding response OmpR family regulator
MKILIAEDDSSIRTVAKMVLEKIGGHTVVVAQDGQQAFDLGAQDSFDLIMLDEMMPHLNGLSVCKKLKDHWQEHNPKALLTPIIFLSAKSQELDLALFQEWGHGFIAKPFEPRQLCNEIDKILKRAA